MSQKSKNDQAWLELFGQLKILDEISQNGIFKVSASQINRVREARLMTKFDHAANLPQIFKENNLSILPDTRGTYIIGPFEAYQKIITLPPSTPIEVSFPLGIETIDYSNLYSETAAILCAFNSGIINDLLAEETLFTVAGRMSTSKFDYRIKNNRDNSLYPISVDNAQCEIDAGFEGVTKFGIVEAKNYSIDDFLIRQLYYPYRLWQRKTSKKVVPIFMYYSNDIFYCQVYQFRDDLAYNSIELVEAKTYQIGSENIELSDIFSIFESTSIIPEPSNVPFPQADNFYRVVDLLGLLYVNDLSQDNITSNYQFDKRQTQYYTSAAIYLGLVAKRRDAIDGVIYSLTEVGKAIMDKSGKSKYLALVQHILSYKVFHDTMAWYFAKGIRPTQAVITQIMANANLPLNSDTTMPRRAQSVMSWIDWILNLCRQ